MEWGYSYRAYLLVTFLLDYIYRNIVCTRKDKEVINAVADIKIAGSINREVILITKMEVL